MGFLDGLLGRTKAVPPRLDALFALPTAALTLEASAGFRPTGSGSVCFRAAEGGTFSSIQADVAALLDADDGPDVEASTDSYGFTWLMVRTDPPDVPSLVTDLHAVNSTLEAAGFGPQLLCSLVGFERGDGRRMALVYLYKRGSFYPFAPAPDNAPGREKRDNTLELSVRGQLGADLPVEADLSRWFPVWGAPGL